MRHPAVVAKYDGLARYLRGVPGERAVLNFEQVAALVPGGLPPSAYRHPAWWANQADGAHVHAQAWLDAGWRVASLDLPGRVVTFARG